MKIKSILSFLLFIILQLSLKNSFARVFSNKELDVSRIGFSRNPNSDFSEPDFIENNIFEAPPLPPVSNWWLEA
jgi:hypothetical protein